MEPPMRFLWTTLLVASFISSLPAQNKGGLGDLMIMPTRVTLEGRDRSAEIMLRNSGKEACTYRVFFQEMRMNPDGQVTLVPKTEGVLNASDIVVYTPKQVELLPGEIQTVRIHLRKPDGLKDGEYRSHMVFQALPPVEPPKPLQAEDDNTVSFDIKTIVSISIPVIVRHGETKANLSLSSMVLKPASSPTDPSILDLVVDRQGNRSTQGELKVDWIPASGKAQTIVPALGCVLYPEVASLPVQVKLPNNKDVTFKDGRLKVTYTYKDVKQPPLVAFLDVK